MILPFHVFKIDEFGSHFTLLTIEMQKPVMQLIITQKSQRCNYTVVSLQADSQSGIGCRHIGHGIFTYINSFLTVPLLFVCASILLISIT